MKMRPTQEDTVHFAWVGCDNHGSRVNELMIQLDIRELILEDVRNCGSPQSARG